VLHDFHVRIEHTTHQFVWVVLLRIELEELDDLEVAFEVRVFQRTADQLRIVPVHVGHSQPGIGPIHNVSETQRRFFSLTKYLSALAS
jgi:hypothetical protein